MSNVVDKEAREKIERLERRLEGAHLTPGIWQIIKQMLQAIMSWAGWEIFGVGFFILLGIFLLSLIVFGFHGGCSAREVDRYSPTCEALGLTFTETQNGRVVCTGQDRIVSVSTTDLNDTEVYLIPSGETLRVEAGHE